MVMADGAVAKAYLGVQGLSCNLEIEGPHGTAMADGQDWLCSCLLHDLSQSDQHALTDLVHTFSAIGNEEVFKRGSSWSKFRLQTFRLSLKKTKVPFFNALKASVVGSTRDKLQRIRSLLLSGRIELTKTNAPLFQISSCLVCLILSQFSQRGVTSSLHQAFLIEKGLPMPHQIKCFCHQSSLL